MNDANKLKTRARWRKQPSEGGLRSIGQTPRGYELRKGEEEIISVLAAGGGWRSDLRGWYWVGMGINTYKTKPLFNAAEEAKAGADAYYKANKSASGNEP